MAMNTTYEDILSILRRTDAEVKMVVRVGSHVYSTANADSDEDFVAIVPDNVARDLILRPKVNITLMSEASYVESLENQNIFALECRFAPSRHQLKYAEYPWKFNRIGLCFSAQERSKADYSKAIKANPFDIKARKRLFHSLRVLEFAQQVLRLGKIVDFAAAQGHYLEIMTDPSEDPTSYIRTFGPVHMKLYTDLI